MLKSKFFRVAKAGQTIDGREITSQQIDQMAANYDPKKYGARIWVEHFRGLLPESIFPAMGDVLALSTESDAEGAKYLTAQLSPTEQLRKVNASRQKVFTSIEIDPKFSDTDEAYLVGLAVTDSPASLGTDMLHFAIANREKFKAGSELPDTLFSENLEGPKLEFEEEASPNPDTVFSKVKTLLTGKQKGDEKRFSQLEDSVLAIAETLSNLEQKIADVSDTSDFSTEIAGVKSDLQNLTKQLSNSSDTNQPSRPLADGTGGHQLTDC